MRITFRARSLGKMPGGSAPRKLIRMLSGTRNQVRPVANVTAMSVEPKPAELAKGLDRQRARHVVGHGIVDRGDHDLARMNWAAEPSGEDLFSQCSHLISPKRGPIPGASRRVRRWSTGPNPRAV